jgi:arginine exporter protein ArgO
MDAVIAGLWAGYGLAVPVGAVAVLMVNTAARTSFGIGAAAAGGAVTADAGYAIAAVVGGGSLAATLQPWSGPLRVASALVLIAMAAHIVRSALHPAAGPARGMVPTNHLRSYVTYLGLTALNPWPAIYFVALMLGRQAHTAGAPAHTTVYVAAIVAASASWQLFLAASGATLGRLLTSRRGELVTAATSGVLIAVLAIRTASSA